MTAYKNFVTEFPARCSYLIDSFFEQAKDNDLDVTMLLGIGALGLIVLVERLLKEGHPSNDRTRHSSAFIEFNKETNEHICFKKSIFWHSSFTSWKCGKIKDISGDPDSWDELRMAKQISNQKLSSTVLKHLRNALAHGNIYTTGDPISEIIFLSSLHYS